MLLRFFFTRAESNRLSINENRNYKIFKSKIEKYRHKTATIPDCCVLVYLRIFAVSVLTGRGQLYCEIAIK